MLARLAIAAVAFVLAGCGTTAPTPTPTATATPRGISQTASPASTGSGGPVAIDPSLLEHLPARVDGLDLMRRPESDAAAAADPVVVAFGEGVVTVLAVDPGTDDFAYAALVRLRDGAFSEELFRSWRESFAEGACSQAGGVVRTAVTEIDGRDVHIDSCEGGLRVYHAWLPNSRVLVSVSALGERRLGEQIVQELVD
ncbi:MAG TPA: hypothetical protein VGQ58_10870 [Candidatus Limnocylindrales bacterium]|nr:hypothetical protein [Candidatus Limnocylindrales bacterium]